MHPTRLTDIVQKFEELSMVIRSVFADNNKMSLTRQIFFPPPFLSCSTVMRTQKFDPRDDRLQIKEDWALAELGAKVVVVLEFF